MKRQAWILMMIVAAGCGDNLARNAIAPPGDAPPIDITPPIDAEPPVGLPPIDASPPVDGSPPIDAMPPDLAELCGKVPVTLDDWEDCYAKRLCDVYVGCSIMSPFRDLADCVDRADDYTGGRLGAERRERKRAIESGRASRAEPEFTQCLVDTSRALCDTVLLDVACATRFTGTVADGGDCYADIECASPGATCEASCTDACCPGTCRPSFKLGQSCTAIDSCEPGLACNYTCKLGDLGAPCAESADCDQNAWCHAGRCDLDLPQGAACNSSYQCGGETRCVGLSIRGTPGQCLRVSHAGDHCDIDCFGNLYCDGLGICRDLPELGQRCAAFTPCRGVDTTCDSSGRCVLLPGVGATCGGDQLCRPGLFCTSELSAPNPTCAPRGGTGAPCADPSHCESYRCSGNASTHGVCLAWPDTCPAGSDPETKL